MGEQALVVGDIEVVPILDVDASATIEEMFEDGEPPPGGLETLGARFPDEFTADRWRFRDHCFLIRSPSGVVLIDTGVGPIDSAAGRWLGVTGTLPDQLATLGVAPADIDHVILTHVHSDHIGWSTVALAGGFVPRFPNARYYLHEADLTWFRGFDDEEDLVEFAQALQPLIDSGQLETSPDDRDVLPGLGLRHAPGHTPGHRCVLLDAGEERVLFAGDLLHFSFQLNDATYLSPVDTDAAEGSRSRVTWLDRVEAEGIVLATAHLLPPLARLDREEGRRSLRAR